MGMEATIMRKLLINLVMLILAFTIQICVFPQIAFLSSAPNLLLIVVFVCSFIEGRERGMFYGLVAGLFMDHLAFIHCFSSIWGMSVESATSIIMKTTSRCRCF